MHAQSTIEILCVVFIGITPKLAVANRGSSDTSVRPIRGFPDPFCRLSHLPAKELDNHGVCTDLSRLAT
jgi:hypothetical protein